MIMLIAFLASGIMLLLTAAFVAACRALSSSGGTRTPSIEVETAGTATVSVSRDEDSGDYTVEADLDSPEQHYPEPNESDAVMGLGPDFWEQITQMGSIADREKRIAIGRTLLQYGFLEVDNLMNFVDRFWRTDADDDTMPPGAAPAVAPAPARPARPIPDTRVIYFSEIPTFSDDFAPFTV